MHHSRIRRSRAIELGAVAIAVALGAVAATTAGNAQGAASQGTATPRQSTGALLRTMHVQGNVHVMLGAGSNITVQLGNLGVILVDTGNAPTAERVLATLPQLTKRSVRYIINTHSHPDHVGGNERVGASGGSAPGTRRLERRSSPTRRRSTA
jgi:cyclase